MRRSGALALHRFDLAIRGDEVMRLLGSGPGPHVGLALRFLTECVIEDPACNTPERCARASPMGRRAGVNSASGLSGLRSPATRCAPLRPLAGLASGAVTRETERKVAF